MPTSPTNVRSLWVTTEASCGGLILTGDLWDKMEECTWSASRSRSHAIFLPVSVG